MNIRQQLKEAIVSDSERKKVGIGRDFTQIGDTFMFELKKNLIPFLIMMIITALMFTLFVLLQTLQEVQDVPLPDEAIQYFISYFQYIFGFLVVLTAAGFAGSIIAEDFQKQTGNLIFPKISKSRLFIGRIMARYLMNAICIVFYYILVTSITFIKYGEIPLMGILTSLIWALFYTFALFSMVTFVSSIMKSTSASIIVSVFLYLLVFTMIQQIMNYLAGGVEPWFLLSYYENIITNIVNMPDPRYREVTMGFGPGGGVTFYQWVTPNVLTAFFGILIYSVLFLTLAYVRYRRRQSKSES